MKRLAIGFIFVLAMLVPVQAAQADAPGLLPPGSVDHRSPSGLVTNRFLMHHATVSGESFSLGLIVTHVTFWIDLPQSQRDNPSPSFSCPTSGPGCRYVYTDRESPYLAGVFYGGPSGRHTATVQAWRDVQSDFNAPVFMGQDTSSFCISNCAN